MFPLLRGIKLSSFQLLILICNRREDATFPTLCLYSLIFSAFVLGEGITLGKERLLQEAVDMKIPVGVWRGVDSSLG